MPRGVDDVVGHDGDLAVDVADHTRHLGLVVAGALLVEDDEAAADHLGELAGELRAAGVRGDGDPLDLGAEVVADVLGEHRHGDHVVDGDPEEALHLARMQVHRDHAVDAGGLE